MIVVMKRDSERAQIDSVIKHIEELGLGAHLIEGEERTVIGVVGRTYPELGSALEVLPGVDAIVPISKPYKLSGREVIAEDTVISVRGV